MEGRPRRGGRVLAIVSQAPSGESGFKAAALLLTEPVRDL
jgi:hypothetical protein